MNQVEEHFSVVSNRKIWSRPGKETGVGDVGKRLKEERVRRCYSTTDLCRITGINISQYAGFENRGVMPSIQNLIKIATALDCSIDWLVGLEN